MMREGMPESTPKAEQHADYFAPARAHEALRLDHEHFAERARDKDRFASRRARNRSGQHRNLRYGARNPAPSPGTPSSTR